MPRKLTYKEVKHYIEVESESGCTLLSKEYKNANTNLELKCKCGDISFSSFSNVEKIKGCRKCAIERNTGDKNGNYNPNLTEEERVKKRLILGGKLNKWRNDVYQRDKYTCKYCNKEGGKLNAHHLDGYHWCKEKRTEVPNGATLCESCHKNFHKEYGNWNNTRQQFEEWLENRN